MTQLPPKLLVTCENGEWTVWQRVLGRKTQQAAIYAAKKRAIEIDGTVEWDDGAAGRQGPVKPSKYGVMATEARS